MKNEPLTFEVSLQSACTNPFCAIRTSKALSFGASVESANHIAPWKCKVSPAATQLPSSTSVEITSPSLSLTFNQPRPNELFTFNPVSLDSGVGLNPALPEVSRQLVTNRTFSWSGKLDVT